MYTFGILLVSFPPRNEFVFFFSDVLIWYVEVLGA